MSDKICYVMSPIAGLSEMANRLLGAVCIWHTMKFPEKHEDLVIGGDFTGAEGRNLEIIENLMMHRGVIGSLTPPFFNHVTILAGRSEKLIIETAKYIPYASFNDVARTNAILTGDIHGYGPLTGEDTSSPIPEQYIEWLKALPMHLTEGPLYVGSSASTVGEEYGAEIDDFEWEQRVANSDHLMEVVVGHRTNKNPFLHGCRLNIANNYEWPVGMAMVVALDPDATENPVVGCIAIDQYDHTPRNKIIEIVPIADDW